MLLLLCSAQVDPIKFTVDGYRKVQTATMLAKKIKSEKTLHHIYESVANARNFAVVEPQITRKTIEEKSHRIWYEHRRILATKKYVL